MSLKVRFLTGLFLVVWSSWTVVAWAAGSAFTEGKEYLRLAVPVAPRNEVGVEVVEVFSYGCIHCFNFDPMVEGWAQAQSDGVQFRRMPAIFNKSWELLAQAFYTADVLGVGPQMHQPLFNAIHTDHIDIRDSKKMADLFERHAGVDAEKFSQAFASFGVRSLVQQANGHTRAYRITGVPSMVVAGTYVVDGTMAGSNAKMLEVVEYLINRERNASAGAR